MSGDATKSNPTLFLGLDSILEPIDPQKVFASKLSLEVELGSGDGSFLVNFAQQNSDKHFIGVERLLGRARKINRKGLRAELKNLRVVRIEASYFLEFLLPEKSLTALHIYFPDPWPKRKHRKNRLVNDRFTTLAQKVLQPGGTVYLRTDDVDYFTQMTTVFAENSAFAKTETPESLRYILTDFEKVFQQRGIQTLHAAYRLL